jgi:hypothetical protein
MKPGYSGGVRAVFASVGWYGWTKSGSEEKLKLLDPAQDTETAPVMAAIDAIKANFEKYERTHLELMLGKAYTGFAACVHVANTGDDAITIATGNWGCGAFHNNERVMFVVQTLAAHLAGVELKFHVLGDGL